MFSLILGGASVACFQSDRPPLDEVYYPLTPEDLDDVRAIWEARDLSARAVDIVYEDTVDDFTVAIVRHEVLSNVHYGAILAPVGDLTNTPVFVDAEGLNQDYPAIDLEGVIENHQRNPQTATLIKVVPSFRGQTLKYDGMSFPSEGDFCDAYDGAADDAIAMLNVAEELLPEANFSKILAFGASRGGNTALLMGVRDNRVNTIISQAAPVDFYWEPLREKYGDQFVCQFLEGKTAEQARERIIASSPIFFEMNESVEHVFLYHGSRDSVVPLWNSNDMATRLRENGVAVTTFYYPWSTHGSFIRMPQYPTDRASAISQFLENVGHQ